MISLFRRILTGGCRDFSLVNSIFMTVNNIFTIRAMTVDDLDQAIRLSSAEGWNQTENDWRLLLENPCNICLVATIKNKIAGTATAIDHSGKVAWIGMVLVDKALRGQGAGKMLLTHLIENLNHVESIKLDATPSGQTLYRDLGFIEEYRIFRMTTNSLRYIQPTDKTVEKPVRINNDILPEVIDLDRLIFGADRNYLLKRLYKNYNAKAFYCGSDTQPDGYIFGRNGLRFNYIGPVGAFSKESALCLLAKAFESLIDQPVAIDIPEDKQELIEWFESAGFVKQRYFVRMFLKNNPFPGVIESQYLISGPEFG